MAADGGSGKQKTLVKPGYHLKPKYDLHGLRRKRGGEGSAHLAGELPLTSMIDMFSVLVIYLLMNFSATGDSFFVNRNLKLPKAGLTNPLESAPLISIVDGKFILNVADDRDRIDVTDDSPNLEALVTSLTRLKEIEGKAPKPSTRINLQASEESEIGEIKRAMAAAVRAGWTDINFVVEKKR